MSPTLNASLELVLFWPSLLCPLPVQGNPSTGRQIPPHEQYVVPAQAQPPPPPPHGQADDVLQSHCEHTHCLTSYEQSTGSLTGGGGAALQYLSACPPQVDVTPGTAAAQTRQSPTLATLALAQRKAKQPSHSLLSTVSPRPAYERDTTILKPCCRAAHRSSVTISARSSRSCCSSKAEIRGRRGSGCSAAPARPAVCRSLSRCLPLHHTGGSANHVARGGA